MEIEKLSVVVSCLNEKENLRRFSDEIIRFLEKQSYKYELVLVDDGSTDGSWDVIRELANKYANVIPARHVENRGLGAGLRTGFSLASGNFILTLDADLTFHPTEIPILVDALDHSTDIVIGSAFLGSMKDVVVVRKWLSLAVNAVYQMLLKEPITAVSSIFRLYRTSLIKSLTLSSNSFDINAEILFKAIQRKVRMKEVPATLTKRIYGKSKISLMKEMKNHFLMFIRILLWRRSSQARSY